MNLNQVNVEVSDAARASALYEALGLTAVVLGEHFIVACALAV